MFSGASQFAENHLTRLHTRPPHNPNFQFHNHHTRFCEKPQLLEAKGWTSLPLNSIVHGTFYTSCYKYGTPACFSYLSFVNRVLIFHLAMALSRFNICLHTHCPIQPVNGPLHPAFPLVIQYDPIWLPCIYWARCPIHD
jgi:hypothetical protein